jgi:hypothetical protein
VPATVLTRILGHGRDGDAPARASGDRAPGRVGFRVAGLRRLALLVSCAAVATATGHLPLPAPVTVHADSYACNVPRTEFGNSAGVIMPASAWAGPLLNLQPPADGATLDVYSNLSYGSCANGSWLGWDQWGLEMQCTEFGVRVADFEWHTGGNSTWSTAGWSGAASDMYRVAPNLGMRQFPNGGATMPQLGDLLVIADSGVGHVGVVQGLANGVVSLVGQNQGYGLNTSISYTGSILDSSHFVPGSTVLGWIRGTNSPFPEFAAGSAPPARLRTAYSYQVAATGMAPLSFTMTDGSLPPGLALSGDGLVSGTPTRAGSYTATVRAANKFGQASTRVTVNIPAPGLSGDVTGDGKADIIALNYNPVNNTGSAWVMTSAGPTFRQPRAWSTQAFNGTAAVLAGDVNGDGKTDLIAVNYDPPSGSGSTWVMTSTGSSFAAPQPWSNRAFTGSAALLAGDVNGDGRTDLVAVSYDTANNTGTTSVMLSTGSGFSAPQPWSAQPFNGTSAVIAADVNADSKADLVAVSYDSANRTGRTLVMLSTGAGFTAPQVWSTQPFTASSTILAGDVNGDHKADLVAITYDPATNTGSTRVMTSAGTGFNAPQTWSDQPFDGSASVVVADVNGDRRADVVAVNYDASLNVGSTWSMLSVGGTSFSAPRQWSSQGFNGTSAILAGDVNGDGRADLIAVNYYPASNTGSTWVTTSSGTGFSAPQPWSDQAFGGTAAMLAGDVNGDGKTDLIAVSFSTAAQSGSTWVMTSTGTGFALPQQWSNLAFHGTSAILAGDVNGDGRTDLIAVSYSRAHGTGSTWVMTSTGTGFNAPEMWSSDRFTGTSAILAADVNGDGRTDLVAVSYDTTRSAGSVSVTLSTGTGFRTPEVWSTQPFSGNAAILAGDVNGDGRADLIAVNYSPDGSGSTWVMTSAGTSFYAPQPRSDKAFLGVSAMLSADINGDHAADLVALNYDRSTSTGNTWVVTSLAGSSPAVTFDVALQASADPFYGNRAVP